MNMIDAYCHIGVPRFGTAVQAMAVLDTIGISRAVLVLGPKVPDLRTMFDARNRYGSDIRTIGIPFGDDPSRNNELIMCQLDAGAIGIRLTPEEIAQFPFALQMIGERNGWAYAIHPHKDAQTLHAYIEYLERFPSARVAAPHFLSPVVMQRDDPRYGAFEELLRHPRFHPIFSRHGGVGSIQKYPHPDLKPWVEQIIGLCGADRIMWGSEFPVFFWRDENPQSCRDWLSDLLPELANLSGFLGGNAHDLIFSEPPPPCVKQDIPNWLHNAIDISLPVGMLQGTGIDVPMDAYYGLLTDFLELRAEDPDLSFGRYIGNILETSGRTIMEKQR